MKMEESKAERKAERILKAKTKADLPPMNKERKQSPGSKRVEKESKKREKEKQKVEREFRGVVQKVESA